MAKAYGFSIERRFAVLAEHRPKYIAHLAQSGEGADVAKNRNHEAVLALGGTLQFGESPSDLVGVATFAEPLEFRALPFLCALVDGRSLYGFRFLEVKFIDAASDPGPSGSKAVDPDPPALAPFYCLGAFASSSCLAWRKQSSAWSLWPSFLWR